MNEYLGKDIPKLGFGLMRLPQCGAEIDIEQTKAMVDLFLNAGFNYFDTAYGYGAGASERAIKTALVDRYPRERFYLATKLPAFMAKSRAEAEQMLETSLARTGAGYFDFYLLHNLGAGRTQFYEDYGMWDFVLRKKEEGVLRHIGFSIHDGAEALDRVLTAHPEAEFVQLQINYADWDDPGVQARECYAVARAHGKPIIIMEPVKGGTLSTLPPEAAAPLLDARPDASLSSWALRYAASLEGLVTVLSGMSDLAQMRDNLATMTQFQPLTDAERAALERTRAILAAADTVPCTACNYCTAGCPQHIGIPEALEALNLYRTYHSAARAKDSFAWPLSQGKHRASECIACGACEAVCPQRIPIIEELKAAAAVVDAD